MARIGGGTGRDVVVIGCSAGGVEALPRLLAQLPADLPATVCIVQHLVAGSRLVEILQRATSMPVQWGEHGDPLIAGEVSVAPGGVHMLLDEHGQIALTGGPRENWARPSINRLFRSAAAYHGSRTIGVLLTGMLDDGVAGLAAIKKVGGLVIVQDPDDAAFPDMPRHALAGVPVDRVLPLDRIGAALIRMCGEPAPAIAVPPELLTEARIDAGGPPRPELLAELGQQVPIACPECHGTMWEVGAADTRSYRCSLGHGMSPAALLASQSQEIEQAMWVAVRSLQERATTLSRLAADSAQLDNPRLAADLAARARAAGDQAEHVRQLLLTLQQAQSST